MTAAVLGLGANLGDPRAALAGALVALENQPELRITSVSGLWRTAPVGGPEQPEFRNVVVVVATTLTPAELLALAHRLEAEAGRIRDVRWGPRTLDVDVLDVAGVTSDDPALTVPHPRAHERGFVLAPWAQIAPDWVLTPAGEPGRTVAGWADSVLAAESADAVVLVAEGVWWR